jgi:hypothetical protein
MVELMGGPPTAPAPATTPRFDPEVSLATEMAERAARSVAEEPATLDGMIEVRARPAALWQRITAFLVDSALIGGVLALYVGLATALITPRRSSPASTGSWPACTS